MCGRYTLTTEALDLSWLGIAGKEPHPPAYNISPGEQVLIVRHSDSGLEKARVKWGLVPPWLKDFSRAQINARIETAADKPMFRQALQSRRCLVLADGWFDWQVLPDRKQPWYIHARQKRPFAFAGIWERYVVDEQLSFDSCAILTTSAASSLQPLSERMPVLLDPACARQWLQGEMAVDELLAVMKERWLAALQHYPVSQAVSRSSEKRPICIRRLQ